MVVARVLRPTKTVCPDLDLMDSIGRISETQRLKAHMSMMADKECHIYQRVLYCFCGKC